MKKIIYILYLTSAFGFSQSQNVLGEGQRIATIKNQLEILSVDNIGLTEQAKTDINVTNISLSNFLIAISNAHHININIAPDLNQININNNFSNVIVSDLLVFLCKEYQLTIDFTGSILSIKKYTPPIIIPEDHPIYVSYNPQNGTISIDIKNNTLYEVFKHIMDESAKNLVFETGLENKALTFYIKDMPFDAAMNKLALANNLYSEKTKDNFYVFDAGDVSDLQNTNQSNSRIKRGQNLNYKILDIEKKLLEINFYNSPISTIINEISAELNIDIFTATPLDKAGTVTFKAKSILFDDLLVKIFEAQKSTASSGLNQNSKPSTSTPQNGKPTISNTTAVFSFKKAGEIYYFGTENQLSIRKVEVIQLMHRSVELLADPTGGNTRTKNFRSNNSYSNDRNYSNYNSSNNYNNGYSNNTGNSNRNRQPLNTNTSSNFNNQNNKAQALVDILPDEIKLGLDIKMDFELNSFYVNGPSSKIERFKKFIKKIDKPVPVVLIEVMIIEVSKSATVETGVSWGIGENEVKTQGNIFPETDITLGSKTINKVIGGFDGIGSFNLGKVVPEFFANIKALETNGNIKIRSTPKLSTLNGHKATLSNGQTSYYTVTQRNIYGTDNPQTSEIKNYEPIDAELGLTIKPLVSGDGQVTLDIFVIQSSFGNRIDADAPPDLNSREFTSIMRVKDQDIVVLGGLEEHVKNDSGSGVPLLARVPVIKWLFSKRKREDKKTKLTILIKPTIIY